MTSGMAIQRAEDKTAQMQARAGAIDELIASGALDDVTAGRSERRHHPRARGDELQADVEAELARLKGISAPRRLPASRAADAGEIVAAPRSRPVGPDAGKDGQPDHPDPRRGAVRRRRRTRWTGSTSSTPASRRRSRRATRTRSATALVALLDGVRTVGVGHPADSLDESDLILPPADATIDEVRQMLTDDGLIPG